MNNLENKIKNAVNVVKRQYLLSDMNVYISGLEELEEEFFSDDENLKNEAAKHFKDLLSLRQWDDIDDTLSQNNENKDKFKHRFIDDFNNFQEFYQVIENLVKDVEEYHDARLKNVVDSK